MISRSIQLLNFIFQFSLLYHFPVRAADGERPGIGNFNPNPSLRRGQYYYNGVKLDSSEHDREFFTFITRPDLSAPRWTISSPRPNLVSPGFWFTSPYPKVKQEDAEVWTAPYIYSPDGELIWSGAALFGGWGTFDFRVVDITGMQMLSLISYHESCVYILDESYEVFKKIPFGVGEGAREGIEDMINIHEFAAVDNGTRAMYLTRRGDFADRVDSRRVGFNGRCFTLFDGFGELDTSNWESVFEWSSKGHVGLNESYALDKPVEELCADAEGVPWEFLHLNAIAKFPDGDYLISGRRTFTLYKVSHIDGSIVWRLGGKDSDFDLDLEFSGQHGARVHSQNETHTIISFLDNAKFKPYIEPTHENSRGVLLALHTNTNGERRLRAETLMTFDHPDGGYAMARGNMEILPNGNVWTCWARQGLQSEYGPEGELIMKAHFRAKIDTYRSFKSAWVGRPNNPPDVSAVAVMENERMGTLIHVSWNGATEIVRWRVSQTDRSGRHLMLAGREIEKDGFETKILVEEFVRYVSVEALDKDGDVLGKSPVVRTIVPDDLSDAAAEEAVEWDKEQLKAVVEDPTVAFACGFVLCAVLLALAAWAISRTRWMSRFDRAYPKKSAYEPLPTLDNDPP